MAFSLARIPALYLKAPLQILRTPRLLSLTVIPYLLGIVSFVAALVSGFSYHDLVSMLLIDAHEGLLHWLVDWIVAPLLICAASAALAIIVMLTLSGFFLEEIALYVIRREGREVETETGLSGFTFALLRSLGDNLVRLLYVIPLILITFLVSFLPPLYIFPLLLSAFSIGFDLFDATLTLLEIPFKRRWELILSHRYQVMTVGGILTLLLLIPLGGILFLPVAYYVTAETICSWDISLNTSTGVE